MSLKTFDYYHNLIVNLLLRVKKKITPTQFIFIASIIVGVTCSLIIIILKKIIIFIEEMFITNQTQYLILVIMPLLGMILSGSLIQKFYKKHGHNHDLKKGLNSILINENPISYHFIIGQVITSGICVGLGGALGIESPSVLVGGCLGFNFAKKYFLDKNSQYLLVGSGVAASISAAFSAPIAGVLFAVEILTLNIEVSAIIPMVIASATASIVNKIFLNTPPIFYIHDAFFFKVDYLIYYILLGLVCGIVSIQNKNIFNRIVRKMEVWKVNYLLKSFFGGLIFALLLLLFPSLLGESYYSIKQMGLLHFNSIINYYNTISLSINPKIGIILVMFILIYLKPLVAGLTIGGGGNGGFFAPTLFVGACCGCFVGSIYNLFFIDSLLIKKLILCGMAGTLAASFNAPLTGLFLVCELTQEYQLMIPLMIVISFSLIVSKRFESVKHKWLQIF